MPCGAGFHACTDPVGLFRDTPFSLPRAGLDGFMIFPAVGLSLPRSRPQNRVVMSMQPQPWPEVPADTARVARKAFRKGSLAIRARDELGSWYDDEAFGCGVRGAGEAGDLPGAAGDGDGAAVH